MLVTFAEVLVTGVLDYLLLHFVQVYPLTALATDKITMCTPRWVKVLSRVLLQNSPIKFLCIKFRRLSNPGVGETWFIPKLYLPHGTELVRRS